MRYLGLTLAIAGSQANQHTSRLPIRPKQRPLRYEQLVFSVFHRGGLCFGRHAPSNSGRTAANRGKCAMQGCDTPSEGFAWRKTPIAASPKCAASPTSPGRSTGRREKTRPARPLRRIFREKTHPARTKTPILGQFERAGRTFSRFHDLPATQGELFRACRRRPSSALPISDPAPLVRRAPEDPESPAAVPMSSARALP